MVKRRNARQTMSDKYPRDERGNGSLFLSCSVVFIAAVRDGKCFRSKSLVKCVIEKIMHPGTKEQQEGNLYAHASTYGLKIVPHRHFLRIVYVHYQHLQPV